MSQTAVHPRHLHSRRMREIGQQPPVDVLMLALSLTFGEPGTFHSLKSGIVRDSVLPTALTPKNLRCENERGLFFFVRAKFADWAASSVPNLTEAYRSTSQYNSKREHRSSSRILRSCSLLLLTACLWMMDRDHFQAAALPRPTLPPCHAMP
ncbi:hypothetical protein B0O99DRAFT_178759 [Bisporella sp. PMI_857]|nr:hypothetical protein B0O99DRAFT_178759 [Bisporella sp. PMI_857]